LYDALAAGASGFLLKNAPPAHLLRAVRVVANGEGLLSPQVTSRVIGRFVANAPNKESRDRISQLTTRELEVLILMTAGLNNSEIVERLILGQATIKTHVSNVLAKTGSRDRVQAVVLGHAVGLAAA